MRRRRKGAVKGRRGVGVEAEGRVRKRTETPTHQGRRSKVKPLNRTPC